MAYTLGGVTLPYGLLWEDELSWTPIAQSTEYSLSGALIVEYSEKQSGRPITLSGAADRAWVTRSTMDALRTLLGDTPMTLHTPDARSFSVVWDMNGPPISAKSLRDKWAAETDKYGNLVVKLIEV